MSFVKSTNPLEPFPTSDPTGLPGCLRFFQDAGPWEAGKARITVGLFKINEGHYDRSQAPGVTHHSHVTQPAQQLRQKVSCFIASCAHQIPEVDREEESPTEIQNTPLEHSHQRHGAVLKPRRVLPIVFWTRCVGDNEYLVWYLEWYISQRMLTIGTVHVWSQVLSLTGFMTGIPCSCKESQCGRPWVATQWMWSFGGRHTRNVESQAVSDFLVVIF